MKDKDELALEALFRSEPIADEGFSRRVMARVRRRIWIRRLTVPVAFVIGLLIALQPAVELFGALASMATMLPLDSIGISAAAMPQMSTFVIGGFVIVAALFFIPALED